ncbi:MAG TPA: CehA/McbA family metallohydrolase, partial [Verrucomicrobiaceae bacterium]
YYHLLNCGIRLPPSAGSASGVLPNPVGYNRVYVRVDGPLTWEKWWEGLRAGQVFVTNGPLLRVQADEQWPGHVFHIPPGESLSLKLDAKIEGRDAFSEIEVIRNGKVFRKIPLADWQRDRSLGEIPFKKSGWFLVRIIADNRETFRFASTGPFYVEAADQPRRISRQSAQFFLSWIQDRMARLALADAVQREEVLQPLRTAEKWWQDKVTSATTDN